jgi:integrase
MYVAIYLFEGIPSEGNPVDETAAETLAREIGSRVALRWSGVVEPRPDPFEAHGVRPLSEHLAAWKESLEADGAGSKHVELFTLRARRVVALLMGARLNEIEPARNATRPAIALAAATLSRSVEPAKLCHLVPEAVKKALSVLKDNGRSLQTCNHHRTAIRAFGKWCKKTERTRSNPLVDVKGYNAERDRRHDRRTVSLDELRRLIRVANEGPDVLGMTGPARAMCYRLAVATGLRYSEIAVITPESIDLRAPAVNVEARDTKNGKPARIPLPIELAADLGRFMATLDEGMPIFPLPEEKGAKMLRADLEAAGIAYRDGAGRFFDFHSLRCETATLADAAGVSPRVVQRLMRHSSLELTGRYTRPRDEDVEAAASMLPSLKPE